MDNQYAPSKVPTTWSTICAVPVGWMKQFRYLSKMYERIQSIDGDVVECGVGQGSTLSMFAYFAGSELRQPKRIVWGFDSFEGWPEPSVYDESPRNPKQGEWRVSEEQVRERLNDSKIGDEYPNLEVRLIKGFFRDTLQQFPKERQISLLHIDADLYEGYRDALTNLFPAVAKGGIILFDEYKEFPKLPEYDFGKIEKWPGCTKAVNEYLEEKVQNIQFFQETGKYFLVK